MLKEIEKNIIKPDTISGEIINKDKTNFKDISKESYVGKILISTPFVNDDTFNKSVIFICKSDKDGVMGIIINKLKKDITCLDVVKQMEINNTLKFLPSINYGGPVEESKGFIIHSSDYHSDYTVEISKDIKLTATASILEDIISGVGPKDYFIALGYTGWSQKQFEDELKVNNWFLVDCDYDTLFSDTVNSDKWNSLLNKNGINLLNFLPEISEVLN